MEYRIRLQELGITLDKSGKQTCPQCSKYRKNKLDKCLSVTYSDEAVLYKCHHCDWSGAVFYREKYERKRNYNKPEHIKEIDDQQPLYNYFAKRGISKATLMTYDVIYSDKKDIVFKYYKNGELVNNKYRVNLGNGKKTFRQDANTEKTFYGMDIVPNDAKDLIIVEGEIDVLSFAEQGILNVVSIPQGASENKLECMENCYDFLQKFDTFILAVDNDTAGDKLKNNLLNRLGKEKCKIVNWKQYKDANEALVAGENLETFYKNATEIHPEGIINFADAFDEIYKYNFEADKDFYSTGWKSVDNLIKLRTGHLMIVTGYPSRGKTTFTDNLLVNLTKQYGMKHLIASFESVMATHYNTLFEMFEMKPVKFAINDLFNDTYRKIIDHFYRFDVSKIWTIDEICQRTELAVKKYGIKTLTIDPYNRLNNEYKEREDKYIGSILAKLCMLAKKLDILIIFVAHPRKPDGEKMPNMYSISGSGDWYNMADYGIIVHRDRATNGELLNTPKVVVEKVKNFTLGKPSGGIVELKYNVDRRILEDVSIF